MSRGWPELHGAVLDRVTVDWRNSQARIDFLPSASLAVAAWIRAHEVTRVEMPMKHPRGDNKHVQAVRRAEMDRRLEIEMQSGDVIVIEAGRFAFERADG
jgi:hypothetical protein